MKQTPIQQKLSEQDEAELQKCKTSPVYFYNKYVRKEGQRELTEEEYFGMAKIREAVGFIRGRRGNLIGMYPLIPKDCFKTEQPK
jgi:hypothetical protein